MVRESMKCNHRKNKKHVLWTDSTTQRMKGTEFIVLSKPQGSVIPTGANVGTRICLQVQGVSKGVLSKRFFQKRTTKSRNWYIK